ncbi:hypothetical protein GYMLUDRAFT_1005610 [Collybiopsis luxurians FD-317 M1]|uniref:NmrA-like domain-containing protein n=1 Tax=Collybiopsis luxurians FD-317 M1 TaxID=944289 RepID=A0A0D0CSQ3_9AGAR|nr:hypothetical protein GYMLUDRAFT_1005610 [Collybiopsis luxurians FD-317 M1]
MSKKVLVIGATGSQGIPVIAALLAPDEAGNPSPYSVRAFTRNPLSKKAQILASLPGVEVFKGSFNDMSTLAPAMEGCYGIFANTDTAVVGEQGEIYAAIKMFEKAHCVPQMRHFIWSSLDYGYKFGGYDLKYHAPHMNAKGIFTEFLRAQDSDPSGEAFAWTVLTTGPYIENLAGRMLGPQPQRENGALVFDTPTKDGLIPMISLDDIAWWTRYTFDHLPETSGQELKIATEMMSINQVVEIFTRVTGIPAVRKHISVEEYWAKRSSFTPMRYLEATYSAVCNVWRDTILTRDMEWIRKVHPTGFTLETWIKTKGYDGSLVPDMSHLPSEAERKLLSK